ncbi:unnamed protein product [Allacma fusca]|uniref:Protein phosphatase methylesterase 1 n=1 Tax=Allacma fusca TaxID=39272 RepID=A0A8J2KET9_9HEXA|nr:unnamed protein product [Allacma fusca]
MSSLQKSVLKSSLGNYTLPPRNPAGGFGRNRQPPDFNPVHWSVYFEKKDIVQANGNKFCVYSVLPETLQGMPVVTLLHGGGFSGLSWAVMGKILSTYINAQVIAIDLRGHGETATSNDDDLSAETMANDILDIFTELKLQNNPIIIVGHSLGGALAVHSTEKVLEGQEFNVVAITVIDVVEGSAMESLSTMHAVLKQRPKSFPTLTRAIEWSMKSGVIKNRDSAKVSMPGQLKVILTDEPATTHVSPPSSDSGIVAQGETGAQPIDNCSEAVSEKSSPAVHPDAILEEQEEDELPKDIDQSFPPPLPPAPSKDNYTWRIDLHKTEPFWQGWFKGMSSKFLSLQCPKLLMLAGVDRLDRDLTVGQMQGKFQMNVISNVGHAVHEDSPEEVVEYVSAFLVRHKLVESKKDFHPVMPGC